MTADGSGTVAIALAVLAIAGAGWLGFRAGQRGKREEIALVNAEATETVLSAADGVALVWDAEDAGDGGWGTPLVAASAAVRARLTTALALSPAADAGVILDALAERAPDLSTALSALRREGIPFVLSTTAGALLGRTIGPRALLWITPVLTGPVVVDALEQAPLPAWRVGGDGALIWANAACLSAVEASSLSEALERQLWFDGATSRDARAAIGGRAHDEVRAVTVGGKRRSYRITSFPCPGGAVGLAFDVTEQMEAHEALTRETRAHTETLDHLTDAVAVFGPDRRLTSRNRAFTALWGLEEAWLDDRPSHGEILDRLRDRRRLPQPPSYAQWKADELALYTSSGALQDALWTLPDGRTLRVARQRQPDGGLLLLFEDITDTVSLKAQFRTQLDVQRATLDKLSVAVAVFGADGQLRLSNQAFSDIWGLEDGFAATHPDFTAFVAQVTALYPDDDFWSDTQARITDPSAHARQETAGEMTRTDKTLLKWLTRPLPDGATLLAFTDVTDAKRAEDALRESAMAFEEADRLKTEFVRNVSYQLRTPLTTIGGYAEMLETGIGGSLTPAQAKHVGTIRTAADQLGKMIENILDLAMIEAGKLELDLGDVRVCEALDEAVSMSATKATETRVSVQVQCEPDVGIIRADGKRIRQVLFNLVSNALAHTREGDTITLGARRSGDSVALWVSDTGEALDAERQVSAFDGFTSGDRRGGGVSLALVRRFVELHGGWVSLRSSPGQGTVVTCHLPVVASPQHASPELDLASS